MTASAKLRRISSREQGSAIVETAMSITILLTMLFGVMEGAFAVYSYHFISDAAREGTRYAIVRGNSAGPTCSSYTSAACSATPAQIQSYVKNLGFPGINPDNMTVNVSNSGYPSGTPCTPSANCNNPGNQVTVTVTYSFPLMVPFIPSHTYAMSSSAAMIIAQ
jgi:Flp pilus assembly protein TadG